MSVLAGGAVILGIGQPLAGDDGVGILVARALEARGVAAVESTDATILLTLLAGGRRVVIVDAVVGGGSAGDVLRIRPDTLGKGAQPVSSHGLGVTETLALACLLHGVDVSRAVEIVGVVIAAPPPLHSGLSPAVAAAIGPAAALAERLARPRP